MYKDSVQWASIVITVLNMWISYKVDNCLTSMELIMFSNGSPKKLLSFLKVTTVLYDINVTLTYLYMMNC